MSFFPYAVIFFTSIFNFVSFFSLLCYFLSPKLTFLCLVYTMFWIFFHLNFHFSVFLTLCCDFLLPTLTFYVFFPWACFEPSQVNIGDKTAENFFDQFLATETICRQHLTNKIPIKWLTQQQWRECNHTTNCSTCVKLFKSTDKKRLWPPSFGKWILKSSWQHTRLEWLLPCHFLFNIRNYLCEVRNIQRREAGLNYQEWIIPDIKQKMAWKQLFKLRVLSTGLQYSSVK